METDSRKYYDAYEERYKTAHHHGVSWSSCMHTPIVLETIRKYSIPPQAPLLEIGCGEGRDARAVLENGYSLLATDISREAIRYCRESMPDFREHFQVLDCLSGELSQCFDFIYSVAVIHMLVPERDRDDFYRFIYRHLNPHGFALICTMGDGEFEMQSDISQAFELQQRHHETGPMMVAATSCRMVSFKSFEAELRRNHLQIVEKGFAAALPDFNRLMFAVVQRE